jgi:Ribonuclease G/E
VVKADATVAAEIFRAVQAKVTGNGEGDIVVHVHPDLAAYFEGEGRDGLARLARALDRKIIIERVVKPHRDEYDVAMR